MVPSELKGLFFKRKAALFIFFAALFFFSNSAASSNTVFQSGPGQNALIELYSSEGCSSCPPAEEWMSGLKDSPYLWISFVPVTFHVDYWDYLGWKDSFGSPQFSQRQKAYLARWKSGPAYTPMIVTNGRESKDWYRTPTLTIDGSKDAGVLKVENLGGGGFDVSYTPHNGIYMGKVFVHAAYLGCGTSILIEKGENQGKKLTHDFTALSLEKKEMSYERGTLKATLKFNFSGLQGKAPRHGLAVWVSRRENSEPIQAAGGYLD